MLVCALQAEAVIHLLFLRLEAWCHLMLTHPTNRLTILVRQLLNAMLAYTSIDLDEERLICHRDIAVALVARAHLLLCNHLKYTFLSLHIDISAASVRHMVLNIISSVLLNLL